MEGKQSEIKPYSFLYKGMPFGNQTTPEILGRVEKFSFRPSDIVLCTYPRSGTTVTQEIIWHIKNKSTIQNDMQYGHILKRFPFIEFNSAVRAPHIPICIDSLEKEEKEPRLIKTHLPLTFFNNKDGKNTLFDPSVEPAGNPKIIWVYRNPRDVAVSLFHFHKNMPALCEWSGEWNEFAEWYLQGTIVAGSWLTYNMEWWRVVKSKQPSYENILLLKYEDIITDMKSQILKIAKFLDEDLTEQQLATIVHNCNFKSMSKPGEDNAIGDFASKFFRKGEVGDWKNYFSEDQIEKFQKVVENEAIKEGLTFDLE